MKKPQFAKLVLVSSIALALTACGSDDDDNNAAPAPITPAQRKESGIDAKPKARGPKPAEGEATDQAAASADGAEPAK